MSFDGEDRQWKCGTGGAVNLQKVSSIVRDIGEPCLHQSPIKISKMLKPEKWQATFDREGKIFGFQKVLKLIILGGVDPSIRPEVWEFLLGCYALSSTAEYRNHLRTARRERYNNLIRECQTMHSSIGTGSLAYVVGSKVMDMRTSSKDDGTRQSDAKSISASGAKTNKYDNYSNCDNCIDTVCKCERESSIDSGDLISVRGSTDGAAYDSSCSVPITDSYNCGSLTIENEAYASEDVIQSFFDFPTLPVTDLFQNEKVEQRRSSYDDRIPTRRKLRFADDQMHSFKINNNADLVVESNGSLSHDLHSSNPEIERIHHGVNDTVLRSNYLEDETKMLNSLRISDLPDTPAMGATTSQQGATFREDRVSEWLWTLHRIVVDVVRTDSHLDFYKDTKNLARMSDILAVYAWVDPATGYCQGMSDLLSPFVVLFEDNADAFWCFEMLLRRMRENFQMEGPTGVMKQLQALWNILELTDVEMFSHLARIGAESLHFAFRMLLVLFRRELSFNEALCMWEMMWAADFDEYMACHLEENCADLLVIQIPKEAETETEEEIPGSTNNGLKGNLSPKDGIVQIVEHPTSENSGTKSSSAHPFCGLTKNFWSKNDRMHCRSEVTSMRSSNDKLPVFCVAAILIVNRQKIIRETRSIDDLIKMFNDKMLKIRVKRCVRTAVKLRKKYLYKLIRSRSPAAQSCD